MGEATAVNLKQALARGKLKQFAKEHENPDPHPMGKERFEGLMDAMVKGKPPPPEVDVPRSPSANRSGYPSRLRIIGGNSDGVASAGLALCSLSDFGVTAGFMKHHNM